MSYYPVPTANDTLGVYEFFHYVNFVADGIFFPALMFVIWIIIFLATKQYSTSRAWTAASFMCSILSILLAIMDLINPKIMYSFFILLVIGLIWLKLETE